MIRIAVCLLVDDRGWVLLQERDSGAPRSPDMWGMVGGHVEDGESFEDAVYREVAEETGLALERGSISLWHDGVFSYRDPDEDFRFHVYAGRTQATDADIVVGEGRRIVFVDPQHIPGLPTSQSVAHYLPLFLASDTYRELAGAMPNRSSSQA